MNYKKKKKNTKEKQLFIFLCFFKEELISLFFSFCLQ